MNQSSDDLIRGSPISLPCAAPENDFLRDLVLPCSLAGLVFGQIFFSFLKYHFEVLHPSWPLWGIVALSSAFTLRQRAIFKLSHPDVLFLLFLTALIFLFVYHRNVSLVELSKFVISLVCLPYFAGRSLTARGISNFAKSSLVICIASIAIICFELISLPTAARMTDRIELFSAEFPRNSLVGDPTTANVGAVAGGVVFLSICLLFAERKSSPSWIAVAFVGGLAGAALNMNIIAGSRSSLTATFFIALFATGITGLKHLPQKAALLVALGLFASVPFHTDIISDARKNLLMGKGAASIDSVAAYKRMHKPGSVSTDSSTDSSSDEGCEFYGNSLSTRVQYLISAVELFRSHPIVGVGPGNFGLRYCGTTKAAFVPPHNIAVQSFVELGVLGGLAFCGSVLFAVYRAIRRLQPPQRLAITAMVFFGTIALLTGDMFRSYDYYAALGVLVAAGSLSRHPPFKVE